MIDAEMKMTPVITPVATLAPIEKSPITISITFNGSQVDLTLDDDSNISTVADLIAVALKFDNVVDFSIFVEEHEELTNMAEELKEIYALTRDTRTEEPSQTVMKSLTDFYKESTVLTYHAFQTDVLAIISARTNGFNNATPQPNWEDVNDCIQQFLIKNNIELTARELVGVTYSKDNILSKWQDTWDRKHANQMITKTLSDHYGLPLSTQLKDLLTKDLLVFLPVRSKVFMSGNSLTEYFNTQLEKFLGTIGVILTPTEISWVDEYIKPDTMMTWQLKHFPPIEPSFPHFTLTPNSQPPEKTMNESTTATTNTTEPVKNIRIPHNPNGTIRVTVLKKNTPATKLGVYGLAALAVVAVGGFFAWKKFR